MKTNISRRDMLRYGLLGTAGLCLSGHPTLRLWGADTMPGRSPKAKSVIQIWLNGGPAHLDTFDPKPEAGSDYTGPFRSPVQTNVGGTWICELLPLLAKQADKYSIIRGMTHGSDAHETATYITQTGRMPDGRLVYPCAGAVVSLFKGYDGGYQGRIPPYITLTEQLGRFDEAGFLGTRFRPFATGGDPAAERFVVEGIVAEGISEDDQRARRELLNKLDRFKHALPNNPGLRAFVRSQDQAYDMIIGDGARAFDLSGEDEALRDRYGRATVVGAGTGSRVPDRATFGQACLVARRLVERGVPYVTINDTGWDTHKDHFPEMRRKLPEFDQGMATLLEDLARRGLLESTIVWCGGEFGRTPKINWEPPWNGGRGHWGRAFSAVVAGGGFQGGRVVGSTDAKGEEVRDRPVHPGDLIASIHHLLGIDPAARLPNPEGLDLRVMPTAAEGVPTGGLLQEIM